MDDAMTGDPRTEALRWVREQGFGLEHRAARALGRSAGFQASRVTTYRDPKTGAIREVDVVSKAILTNNAIALFVVVECKRAKKPWIAVTADLNRAETMWTPLSKGNLPWWFREHPEVVRAATPLKPPLAYRLVQAHNDSGNDPAYTALSQLVDAAEGVLRSHDSASESPIVMPALVVDQPLFLLTFRDDVQENLEEVRWVRLLWSSVHEPGASMAIDDVRDSYLEAYALEMRDLLGELADQLSPRVSEWE